MARDKSVRKEKREQPGKRIFRCIGRCVAGFVAVSVFFVLLYRFVPVYFTPLMLIRVAEQWSEGEKLQIKHSWVPLKEISKNLPLAVICSEDQNFIDHFGFDLKAIQQSVEASLKTAKSQKGAKRLRGASTISQQTAKNVFLWPHRSWVRKGFEVYFTLLIELFWSKERILEVYLNSIEMGDGIYGAEAASRNYFNKPAKNLSRTQAAAIAAILPNPHSYSANHPSQYVQRRIGWITNQMNRFGAVKFE